MTYTVKNCPCYEFGFCTSHHIKVRGCINCTDCVIKQMIQVCNEYSDKWEDCDFSNGLADEILQLFDIEVINK